MYSGVLMSVPIMAGRKNLESLVAASRLLSSYCFFSSPFRNSERVSMNSVLASRASAVISARAPDGASSACKIRSTSSTDGIIRPVSILEILLWLMAHRAPSRSPVSPACLRN